MSTPELTDAEKSMAAAIGMTPEAYAGWKQKQPDVAALDPGPASAEHEKLKAAVREVLDERDGATP